MVRDLLQGEPVLVDCPRGARQVRVRPAFRVDAETYAVIESVGWEVAGELITQTTMQDGQIRSVWKAISAGGSAVVADTRAGVIKALLAVRAEYEVSIDQTMAPLFNLED